MNLNTFRFLFLWLFLIFNERKVSFRETRVIKTADDNETKSFRGNLIEIYNNKTKLNGSFRRIVSEDDKKRR